MHLRTEALDCLYLNWALPLGSAPALLPPLRYEIHRWQGEDFVFASALLFRLSGLHLKALPWLRLSYPQMNFRLYVVDGEGMPSVLFHRTLVPFWVVPVSRYLGRQPASAARFSYPEPSRRPDQESWHWAIRGRRQLEVVGRLGSPAPGPGPSLGSWERTVDYFRYRWRGYVQWRGRLRAIRLSRPQIEVWPLDVEVADAELVGDLLHGVEADRLRTPHSAWLCPEIPFIFEIGKSIHLPVARRGVTAAEGLG